MNAFLKKTFLFSIILFSTFDLYGETFISRQIEQNGKLYDIDTYFTSPSNLAINLTNKEFIGEWAVEVLTNTDDYTPITFNESFDRQCIINPFDASIKEVWWNSAKKIDNTALNRAFFQIRVSFTTENGKKDEIYLNWGLLPTRPIISNVDFTYQYNWEHDEIYPNGNFSFDVYSEYAQEFHMYYSQSFLFEPTELLTVMISYDTDGFSRLGYDADWGEYVQVVAVNYFGYVAGDLICTTSYITDEDILKRIEELREEADVKNISSDATAPSYQLKNSILTFDTMVENIYVYDLNGRLQYTAKGCNTVNLSTMPKGIYIIAYQYNSQIYRTKISKL